ncbi:gluconate 2-dehydrogenase subunit 3 family protein [Deminuibacter soli]|uniref:Gluconate 2-dehydrogenase subunit 3 family protein n=1 Tax=Deminuibacter soli TaxID=2291815 RepID=A0A3E1NCK4_9BACT|nr:gluconate 2-dehydrogenase subunit 3 family protein [Deminuibacter soli]RFM25670.1 gluconate 2-dehydrogenase subunit 3 family protein [Deminuibacter soli]
MNRREALSAAAVIFGGTIIGANSFLSGCKTPAAKTGLFADEDVAYMDEISDTIIPDTPGSPGAKAAKVGAFMKTIVTDCYSPEDQQVFVKGLQTLNEAADKAYKKKFAELTAEQKTTVLTAEGKAAQDYDAKRAKDAPSHYFSMLRQLTVWGYFSSEVGATKALRYLPIPGKFDGSFPYKKGDKAWALS